MYSINVFTLVNYAWYILPKEITDDAHPSRAQFCAAHERRIPMQDLVSSPMRNITCGSMVPFSVAGSALGDERKKSGRETNRKGSGKERKREKAP